LAVGEEDRTGVGLDARSCCLDAIYPSGLALGRPAPPDLPHREAHLPELRPGQALARRDQITIQRSFLGHSSFRQITLQCPWARAEKSIYTKTTLDRYSLSLDYAERAILERGNPGSVPGCFMCPSQYTSRGHNDPELTIQRGFLGRL
jgi:hypothetical protein